jgi:hypothetical protein
MLNKGNVLQYKKNSSNLTQRQRYAQIAKGQWTNRNTTWATQSTRGYTNPNNQSLQRVNSVNITLDGQPTLAPVTCPQPFTPVYEPLPATSSSGTNPQVIPPPPPPPTVNTGTELPPTIVEPPVDPVVIQDLGNLVCGTQENICTGELIRQPTDIICHPTTDSDVPGPIMELCWNDGNPTWYPRQRYVMTNSANKWPTNAILLSAIKPLPPVITSISNVENVVTLIWTQDESCLTVNDFIIYEDGIPIQIVPGNIFTTNITVENCATYTFYIVGSNGSVVSDPSNEVSIDIYIPIAPTITSITSTCNGGITINWDTLFTQCFPVDYYTIYQDGLPIATPTSSPYLVTTLPDCTSYSYYITTTYTNGDVSIPSNTATTDIFPCAVQNLAITNLKDTCLTLTWSNPSSICSILSYDLYQVGTGIIYTVAAGVGPYSYTQTGLSPSTSYSFYVVSNGSINAAQSATVSATTNSNAPTLVSVVTSSCSSGTILTWTDPVNTCLTLAGTNIYNNSILIFGTVAGVTTYTILGASLTCGSNSFYVRAVFSDASLSQLSNTITTTLAPCPPTIALDSTTSTTATISWPSPSSRCIINSYNLYIDGSLSNTGITSPYTKTGLTTGQTYTFNVTSVGNSVVSAFSNNLTVVPYSTPVFQSETNICYKTATISWTNVDIPDYYLFNQIGTPSVTNYNNGLSTSYISNNLVNGNSYTFSVTAVYPGGIQKTVTSSSYLQPVTISYFTIGGLYNYTDSGGITTISFDQSTSINTQSSATIRLNCSSSTVTASTVTLVAGGGGGGAGFYFSPSLFIGGGGGGGGSVLFNQLITITTAVISILIGGGGGGGNTGNNGSIGQSTSVDSLTANGGGGGKFGGGSPAGGGGTAGVNAGAGGNGGSPGNGSSGSNGGYSPYSGGGGGGGGASGYNGGAAALNNIGGSGGGSSGSSGSGTGNGGDCSTYGGGGGGGAAEIIPYNGGDGGQGIVVFTIPN